MNVNRAMLTLSLLSGRPLLAAADAAASFCVGTMPKAPNCRSLLRAVRRVTFARPSFGYQGPDNVLIYLDTIYNTLMFDVR